MQLTCGEIDLGLQVTAVISLGFSSLDAVTCLGFSIKAVPQSVLQYTSWDDMKRCLQAGYTWQSHHSLD